jgi:hypothetical protein
MTGLETLYIALGAEAGTIFGCLIGWLRNKEADSTLKFKWNSFILAALLGVGSALVYSFALTETFSIAGVVSAFLGGSGLGYVVPKTIKAI